MGLARTTINQDPMVVVLVLVVDLCYFYCYVDVLVMFIFGLFGFLKYMVRYNISTKIVIFELVVTYSVILIGVLMLWDCILDVVDIENRL